MSGDARMGIASYDGNAEFENRVRISFAGSGTTDGGLAFGGSIRADNAGDGEAGTDGSVFISGAFGKITMGGVDSGDAAAVGQLSSVGYESLGSGNSVGYAADGGDIGFGIANAAFNVDNPTNARVLYTYSTGGVSFSASVSQIDNTEAVRDLNDALLNEYDVNSYGVGVAYTTGAVTVAVGYGTAGVTTDDGDDTNLTDAEVSLTDVSASVKYVAGDTTIKAIYQDKQANSDAAGVNTDIASFVSMGASVDHKIGALTVTAYALTTDIESVPVFGAGNSVQLNRLGLGAAYDLGGGASFKAGWAQLEAVAGNGAASVSESEQAFDAGVNFSF